jgi:3-phytase
MPRLAGAIVMGGVVAGWLACAHRPSAGPEAPSAPSPPAAAVEFLSEVVIPTSARFPGLNGRDDAFGSLSGLARDEATGRYLAVIDERMDARLVWLDIRVAGRTLAVTPTRIAPLAAAPGVDARRVAFADLEAIAALPDGTFVAAEEGHVVPEGRSPQAGVWPPALLAMTRDARVTGLIEFPPMFAIGARARGPAAAAVISGREGGEPAVASRRPGDDETDRRGTRDNQGVESLTRTPDGRLVAGLEQPRYADGEPPRFDRGARTRLVEFVAAGGGWTPARQWIYELSPTPRVAGFDRVCDAGENGLSDLLALDRDRFLALERSCLLNGANAARNAIRLYEVDVSAAQDVSGLDSLIGLEARPARKTLVLDLDTLVPRLSPQLSGLENFEALAFGPPLAGGGRSLLVVSDNNNRATQKNAFLLFALR